METVIEKTKTTKKTGAKKLSKLSMLFASIWVGVFTILKGTGKVELTMNDIILSGSFIVAVWTPAFISIIIDKVKKAN